MKKSIACLAVLALSLFAARAALADQFDDPAGDSGGAPDITVVNVSNDAAGNLTFTVKTNQQAIAADASLYIAFNTDRNAQTGDPDGDEFVLFVDARGWELDRWDGTKYVEASAPSANATYVNGVLTFKVNKVDLGNVNLFLFYAVSFQRDASDREIARDDAPNGTAVYQYGLTAPAVSLLRLSAPVAVPARPVAGKAFVVRFAVTRTDTGGGLASGVATCKVRLGVQPLRALGGVRAGKASCSMLVPKGARGKRLSGTITVTFRNGWVRRSFSYRVP